MNETKQTNKDSILKSLAIFGFIGIIVVIAWLSIQLINAAPGSFSSLASLASSIDSYKQTVVQDHSEIELANIAVTSNNTIINTGEATELAWDTVKVPGSYIFSYECSEGLSVNITSIAGLSNIDCETNYNIGDVDSIAIIVDSEKERYSDLSYSISFLGTNDTSPRAGGNASLTIVNSDIQNIVLDIPTEPEVVNEVIEESVTETATKPEPAPYQQEFVYTIPVSNPAGRTDLSTRFIGTGNIVGKTFFTGQLKQNETGAIQFEVKNYGTKTSGDWSYTVSLPNGGVYESDDLSPLKPNERAVLTVGFPTTDDSTHTFEVKIDELSDSNTRNDKFTQTVIFFK